MTSRKAEANASVESNADREAREARIRRLQTELAALRQAAGVNDGLSPDRSDDDDDASLTTVKVPAAFEPTFLEAQRYVRRYFSSQEQDPSSASISIAGERYVLVRAASLSVEFVQLVKSLYIDKGEAEAQRAANNLLYDLAHAIGQADARAFRQKMKLESPIEALSAGPIHFAFAGWAFVDISADSNPSPDEDFLLLYEHPYSFESHSWLAKGERSGQPVCIMNAGYSSGWCEESFGLPLVAVETECMAAGGECCRFVMAPAGRIEEHVSRLASERGDPSAEATDGVAAEIPEFFFRKRLEDELREANESLEKRVVERTRELEAATSELRVLGSAIENATEGFVIMERREEDGEAVISFVNRGFSEITGMRDADVLGKSPDQLPVASDDRHLLVEIRDRLREGKSVDVEVTALRPDGTEYELEVHAMPADPEKQPAHRWVAILHDVSERKAHLEELQRQALHDELTGLPNRALLYDRIEHCIEGLDRHDKEYGLLLL
ncbi:MAG: PAS domain S-box protein, partial [Gammaproteobacteria bacterium]|nr:PAS domain S-box protein [Gammaproteobacteria bacterium]